MSLGYASPPAQPPQTYLPPLPHDSNSAPSASSEPALDCQSRLLAWQSCHLLLVLANHCTSEHLYNPYRLALFHFTDTTDGVGAK